MASAKTYLHIAPVVLLLLIYFFILWCFLKEEKSMPSRSRFPKRLHLVYGIGRVTNVSMIIRAFNECGLFRGTALEFGSLFGCCCNGRVFCLFVSRWRNVSAASCKLRRKERPVCNNSCHYNSSITTIVLRQGTWLGGGGGGILRFLCAKSNKK